MRISLDTKATVVLGDYTRGGRSRARHPVVALDHDMHPTDHLVPGGILEPRSGQAFLFCTTNIQTSDFIADGITAWWAARGPALSHIKQVVINLDNGPDCDGHRRGFLRRLADFADTTGLTLRLIYYPPYHSKYNAIEHYWGGLERSWNGHLLSTAAIALARASTFVWKGCRTLVTLLPGTYHHPGRMPRAQFAAIEARLQRSTQLPWYDITIAPKTVY